MVTRFSRRPTPRDTPALFSLSPTDPGGPRPTPPGVSR
jgi:hypothetical protein